MGRQLGTEMGGTLEADGGARASRRARRAEGEVTVIPDHHQTWAPMATHALDPRGDRTVSRIVGRRETETAARLEVQVDEAIRDLTRQAFAAFLRSPKLDREAMASLDRTFTAKVVGSGLTKSFMRVSLMARASAPSLRVSAHMVSTKGIRRGGCGSDGVARVLATTMSLTRREFAITTSPLGIEWRQHVADRLHMRGLDRGDAHKRVALDAFDRGWAIEAMALALIAEGVGGTVPVPVAGGVARGVVDAPDPRPPEILSSVGTNQAGVTFGSGTCGHRGGRIDPDRPMPVWTGVTYIGPEDARPGTDRYAEAVAEAEATIAGAMVAAMGRDGDRGAARDAAIAIGRRLLDHARSLGLARAEGRREPRRVDERPWEWQHDAYWEGIGSTPIAGKRWVEIERAPRPRSEASRRASYALGKADGLTGWE